MFVYADHAATTEMSPAAREAMARGVAEYWANPSSLHTAGQKVREVLEDARARIAAGLNAKPREIYFTSGGSESDNQAIRSAALAGARKGKKHLVSTKFEHHAVLHTLAKLEKEGFEVTLLDIPANGIISADQVRRVIRPDTALVTVMYANNEVGTIQPIPEIGAVCHAAGVYFHTDAVQATAHIPIDVQSAQIDMLSMSAHKFGGPKGIGVLYARTGVPLGSLIEGGSQERGRRAGTENTPAVLGMAAAFEESLAHMAETTDRVTQMRDRLIDGLSQIPHSRLSGDRTQRLPGNVHFCFEGIEGESLLLLLDAQGIEASSGSACTSGSLDPSHVLLAMGMPHEIAHGSLRLSIGADNTDEQIDHILKVVPEVVTYLRSMSPVWEDLESGKQPHRI